MSYDILLNYYLQIPTYINKNPLCSMTQLEVHYLSRSVGQIILRLKTIPGSEKRIIIHLTGCYEFN